MPLSRLHVNGLNLNVLAQGQGRPLVMLHGLAGNLTEMQREIDFFSASYQVVAIDARGHGRSDKPQSYTLQDHVNDVLGVMDQLSLGSVFLMGTSMGSYVAQGVAIAQPQRVKKLVLIVSKPSGKTSSTARFLAEHEDEVRGLSPEEVRAFVFDHLFAPTTPPEVRAGVAALAQQQAEAGLTLTPEENLAAQGALEGFDFRPDLPKVTAETLVISGRHDPLNPPRSGEEIASLIPNTTFVVLERSGHAPTVEEPQRLLTLIEDFLRS